VELGDQSFWLAQYLFLLSGYVLSSSSYISFNVFSVDITLNRCFRGWGAFNSIFTYYYSALGHLTGTWLVLSLWAVISLVTSVDFYKGKFVGWVAYGRIRMLMGTMVMLC